MNTNQRKINAPAIALVGAIAINFSVIFLAAGLNTVAFWLVSGGMATIVFASAIRFYQFLVYGPLPRPASPFEAIREEQDNTR